MQCEEKSAKSETPASYISNILVPTYVGLMQTLPKFGTYEIFANFFPRQKLKIFFHRNVF